MKAGEKGQGVRLLDVFVLGPFMIWAGLNARTLPPAARGALVLLGLGTVGYNARNWYAQAMLSDLEDR